MAKHRGKKKNLKKRVQKKAQKLKELTAQDLFMNPALLYSPEFKALPMEKQFQLTSQLKQLRMMSRGGLGAATHTVVSGGGDAGLYHQYMEKGREVQRQQNDVEQLRIGLQAFNDQAKEIKHLEKTVKAMAQREKDSIEQQSKIEDLQQQLAHYQEKELDTRTADLEKQVQEAREKANIANLEQKQKDLVRAEAEYNAIQNSINNNPNIPVPIGNQRIQTELFRQNQDSLIQEQAIFQNQINSYEENGLNDKSEKTEIRLNSLTEEEDDKKKAISEVSIPNDEPLNLIPAPPLTDVETAGIEAEVQLEHQIKTRKEQIEQSEELEKRKKESQEAYERTLHENRYVDIDSPTSAIMLEASKTKALNELDEFLKSVSNPNPTYRERLAEEIMRAEGGAIVSAIRTKMVMDKKILDEAKKEKEKVEREKAELIALLNNDFNIHNYAFNRNVWLSKITQIQTLDQLREVQDMMTKAEYAKGMYDKRLPKNPSWLNSSTKNEGIKRNQRYKNQLDAVEDFLREDFDNRKIKRFYDGTKLRDLSPELLNLSPSLDYKWNDARGYTNRTYPKQEEEEYNDNCHVV